MKLLRMIVVALSICLLAVPALAHHMAVIVSQDNIVNNLTSTQLSRVFRAETRKWPNGRDIVLVLHRDSAGEDITLEHLNKISAAQLHAWRAEHRDGLKLAGSDEEVLSIVETTPGAVGLVDVREVNDRVKVVRIDNKLPHEDGYLPH